MKKTEKRDMGSDALNVASGGTRITSEARAFVLRVGLQRADMICDALRDACQGPDYEQAMRIGTTAIEAAIAELEK